MDLMVFQFIGETVDNAMAAFVEPAATNLIFAIQMLILTGVTLYITLTGYAIATGAVESPFWTFIKQCIKILIIATFALTVDGYVSGVMSAFEGLEYGLSQAMNTSGGDPVSIYKTLDTSMGKGFELIGLCFENAAEAGWSVGSALGWVVAGCIISLGTVLVAVLGGAVVIVAKFSLAVMFALGPIFIACLMFPATARFFDSWFSQVLNYTLTIVIMAIIMTFAMASYDAFISYADLSGNGEDNPMFAALQIGALSGVLCWIIMQAGNMASGLAGGISMAAMTLRHMASPITNTARGTASLGRAINSPSQRLDPATGHQTNSPRFEHFAAGRTVLNPSYMRAVKEKMKDGWKPPKPNEPKWQERTGIKSPRKKK